MDPPQINYVDSNSILVINPAGKMRQVFVPFRAYVLHETNILKKNHWVLIEEVQPHHAPYNLFRLQVNF